MASDDNDPIIDEKNKLVLLWSPKAGCTRSIAMMFNHMGILDEAIKYDPWIHNYQYKVFYDKFGRVTKKQLLSNLYYVFKVIRNPYDRAVSIYIHNMKTGSFKDHDWSFMDFLQELKKNSYFIHHTDKSIYGHCAQQYTPGEEAYVKKYVKLEDAVKDIEEINTSCRTHLDIDNIDMSLMYHHTSRESTATTPVNLSQVKYSLLPKEMPKSYVYFYNPTVRDLVEDLYGEDVRRYGYTFYETSPFVEEKSD